MIVSSKKSKNKTVGLSNEKAPGFFKRMTGKLSKIGKALMFPIATLPIAAILLRMGALIPASGDKVYTSDFSLFIKSILEAGSNAVFGAALPFIFAVGVGFGLSKDKRGEVALAAMIGMFLMTILLSDNQPGAKSLFGSVNLIDKFYGNIDFGSSRPTILTELNEIKEGQAGYETIDRGFYSIFGSKGFDNAMSYNVLNGIIVGSIVAFLYNKFSDVELPKVLGFFSGRRLVPVIVIMSLLVFGLLWALIWPWVGYILYLFSSALSKGASNRWLYGTYSFLYVITNRPLIALGLHHIPNSVLWFQLGEHVNAEGSGTVVGDLNIFSQGKPNADNNSGAFMTGLFPMMLFGLPAMCLAMYHTARPENRAKLVGMFTGAALISFFTGITEPVEFLFYYASPVLLVMHAVLGAIFAFIVGVMNIQLGFGFSAGFIDYLISLPNSLQIVAAKKEAGIYNGFTAILANPFMMLAVGPFVATSYYFVGKFLIKKTNAMTPGREEAVQEQEVQVQTTTGQTIKTKVTKSKYSELTGDIYDMVGQKENIANVDWCATRLRLAVKDMSKVLDSNIKKLDGVLGVVKTGPNDIQIIIGPHVEAVGDTLNQIIKDN